MDNPSIDQRRIRRLERPARSRRRALVALVTGTLLALAPAVAVANHIFSDVPTGSAFHGDIERVYDARITAGCSASTYCPDTNVTRGQMAAFLSRTGGRVAYNSIGFVADIFPAKALAVVNIRAGNVPGGTAFIKLDASATASTENLNATGCIPCVVWFNIVQVDSPNTSLTSTVELYNHRTDLQESASGSVTFVVPVPTGVNVSFVLHAQRAFGSSQVNAVGSLAATYFPFGPNGTDTLTP
jgi:hypothetical protein